MVVKCKFRIIDTLDVSIIRVTCYNRDEVISMNTQQLECFATLAKTLNYARTAEQLSMTQPAVSRQIKSLENELGVQLFQRTTRSVTLTQIGWQFLPDARQILEIYYHSKEWMEIFHKSQRNVLRIGSSAKSSLHCLRRRTTFCRSLPSTKQMPICTALLSISLIWSLA